MSSQENYDDYVFQILEVNEELIENNDEEKGIKIVMGTLRNIREYYQETSNILDVNGKRVEDENKFFNDYLPSPGVKVDKSFIGEKDKNTDLKYAEFSTVRFLLQCRRLSQMMTKTWLDNSDNSVNLSSEEKRIKYMNKIFHLFNYKPQKMSFLKKPESFKPIKRFEHDYLISLSEYLQKVEDQRLDFEEAKSDKEKQENIRKSISYFLNDNKALILSLFLSGQAYIVDDKKKNFQRLNEPIFSTYELIWEYELDLSWDSYYAKREDIARPGYRQIIRQPNTRVTLGLPAKPNEQSLKSEDIVKWVYAKEMPGEKNDFSLGKEEKETKKLQAPGDETKYPFYPEQDSSEWKNKQVKNVFPPYPYIILSCS